jgi:hypothetical protein
MGLISLPAEETMMFATSRSFPVKFLLRSYKCDETHRTREREAPHPPFDQYLLLLGRYESVASWQTSENSTSRHLGE